MNTSELATKYLMSRMRTVEEMRRHLREKECAEEEIEAEIIDLLESRYLDDTEYCKRYFDYSFDKGRGFLRARRELIQKGVKDEVIRAAYDEDVREETEEERAFCQAEKIAAGQKIDRRLLGKIGRRLTALGYGSDVVYGILGRYMRRNDEDTI